jgi:nicotinamide-nucleotide amidase
MARGALSRSRARIAVAVTGIAGPGPSERKPEGRVCFAVAMGGEVASETVEFGPCGRDAVRRASVARALAMVLEALA